MKLPQSLAFFQGTPISLTPICNPSISRVSLYILFFREK
jgi:hypothetical protein